jgi:cytosine/adenosine deaminase-related metal-dependent hydrolase
MTATVIQNVRPMRGETVDIVIREGRIEAIGLDAAHQLAGVEVIEGGGKLVFPGLIDAHTHMEKTLMGLPWHRNDVGPTLVEMIENERRVRRDEEIDFHQQSTRHARAAIAVGTTHIRSHVDVDTEIGLRALHGVLKTKADLADSLTIQTVAFPQSGMLIRPGTVELLIDLVIERTKALGFQGRVVLSHAFALGGVDEDRLAGLVERIIESDIVVMTHGPGGHRLIPNVKKLQAAGVRLCAGNDGIQDAWNPLQRPDMLERAYIMCYRNNLRRDDDIENVLDIVTHGNAAVLGDQDYGLRAGAWADLVLVDGETHVEAMVSRRPRWLVMKHGRVTARDGACVV